MRRAVLAINHSVCFEAKNAREAIREFEDNHEHIDVVTMDIDMPIISGISAVQSMMDINDNAKIVMVTSRGQEDMVKMSIRAGAVGYILKPIDKDKLKHIIDTIF